MALSTRFSNRWRQLFFVGRQAGGGSAASTRSSTRRCGRPDRQLHSSVDERVEVAGGAAGGLGTTGGEKSLQMLFGERQCLSATARLS